ncbi:hypothetical protein FE391_07020 [Nonomuraea sp. KC401]|uniref:hypothetical protein n=1 Tax=unclassified Nonomuraea TaxID=2593643 RepID=UPI0010FDC6D7|nr:MULTISPECIES: hypothetical protein [unclassified Nonomuraea]NBE93826.1 hypothetical protein [Nonomuraea sp. K271]TLF80671.1 hypothetical protein FE391_07020 [Nonomuraea sp. KC401]
MISFMLVAQLGLASVVTAPSPTPMPSELTDAPRGGCAYTQTGVYCSNINGIDGYLKANCTWQGGGEFLCDKPRKQTCTSPADQDTGTAALDCRPVDD